MLSIKVPIDSKKQLPLFLFNELKIFDGWVSDKVIGQRFTLRLVRLGYPGFKVRVQVSDILKWH